MSDGLIVRHEIPPSSDAEWEEALRLYGRDRDEYAGLSTLKRDHAIIDEHNALHASPITSPACARASLRHEESFESLTDAMTGSRRLSLPSSSTQKQSSTNSQSSLHPPANSHNGLVGLNLGIPVNGSGSQSNRAECLSPATHRGSFESDGPSLSEHRGSESHWGGELDLQVGGPRRPPSAGPEVTEEEMKSGAAERRKMREFYGREGWLPGPLPGRHTRLKRKRAIRRLGLCCKIDESMRDRQAVIAKYCQLAKQIFNASDATVSVLMGEEEYMWAADPVAPPLILTALEMPSSHAVVSADHECTVIADLSKDWRFRENPLIQSHEGKFYASAPLRFHRKCGSVDIGALCIFDTEPRDTFDARERGILICLAEMLVNQLITVQSEIMAKKSSSMYEQSINFLRRSVVTDQAKQSKLQKEAERDGRKERRKDEAKAKTMAREASKQKRNPGSTGKSRRSSSATSVAPEPVIAIKTGPRDSKDAKRVAALSDQLLFADASKTLRNILKADHVAMINIDEYQLFIKRASGSETDKTRVKHETKESIISSFLQGKPWPEDIDPVIHYTPRSNETGVHVIGFDAHTGSNDFHFSKPGAEKTIADFIATWLRTRHFWWDREDTEDELSQELMGLMPDSAQTTLATAFLTHDGKARFAIFASWDKPPAEFGDSSTVALPFAWILGGCMMAALAIRKVRQLEQSQINYSNIQAHELRTPLHQILAITQLLRSSMNDLADAPQFNSSSLTTTQQIRDLLPFLDAIDTSGKILHGIVDNILSFLDLKDKDAMAAAQTPSLLSSPTGATQSIEVMFEEIIHEACEEDKRSRKANGQPMCHTETVFEIIPPLLGESVTEDTGGALRRAMSKILSNAYKFIEGEGCVEIYVDDVPSLLPPEGCEDLALSKRISIKIVDNGKGMSPNFVREALGEPWAKEDQYATGSGLSVHLAYRIIDLMGGQMEIQSGPGQGCTVLLEVPVPRRTVTTPTSPKMAANPALDPSHLGKDPEDMQIQRKVALVGFTNKGPSGSLGLERLYQVLKHQYTKLGCEVVDTADAELVIVDGRLEESEYGVALLHDTSSQDIVFLVGEEHEAHPRVLEAAKSLDKRVRRFRKPTTPSILRETLYPGQSQAIQVETTNSRGRVKRGSINSPEEVDEHGHTTSASHGRHSSVSETHRPHFASTPSEGINPTSTEAKSPSAAACLVSRFATFWKPKTLDVEDAVASLSLGDYFSSRKRAPLARTVSNNSSNAHSSRPSVSTADTSSEMNTPNMSTPQMSSEPDTTPMDSASAEDEDTKPEPEPERVKVMVVEDNMVNRKILVKILSSKLPVDVLEAEDGDAAVRLFKDLTTPIIVLLDINMPKMDGYQACIEMRALEKASSRALSQIIAVTALSGEAEKHRGMVECGMNQWHTKPCSKATIHKIVEEARALLLNLDEAIED